MTVSIFLADDHAIVRQGLAAILRTEADFRVIGEAADGLETLKHVKRLRPDVVVLDLMMPSLGGFEVCARLSREQPQTRVVMLSMHSDEGYVAEAARAGAAGYVLKESGIEDLVRAIREAASGRQYWNPQLPPSSSDATPRTGRTVPPEAATRISNREREVLQLTVEGHSGPEIAGRLFISPRTVETHRANLMRKLGVRNQKELVRHALEHGMLTSPGAASVEDSEKTGG